MTMKLGEVAKITIAGYKGYGANGFPAWGYPLIRAVHSFIHMAIQL